MYVYHMSETNRNAEFIASHELFDAVAALVSQYGGEAIRSALQLVEEEAASEDRQHGIATRAELANITEKRMPMSSKAYLAPVGASQKSE